MQLRTIRYEVVDGVARVMLDRPDAGNAIDLALAEDLDQATLACSEDPAVRAVLLTGAGRSFCVGGDLKSFAAQDDLARHVKQVTAHLHVAVSRLARLPAPVVAAVQGSAAGAGMSLALGSDVLLVAASARLVLAYTKIGLSPDGGGSWYLPRQVGMRRALDLALTNRMVPADEAVAWGLASRMVDDDELVAEGERLAAELAGGPTRAIGHAKRLVRESLGNPLETQLELETIALADAARGPDGREGMRAFLEKRAPGFRGS